MTSSFPPDWEVQRLRDCGTWYSGGTPDTKNPDFWDGDIPWISAKSLKRFHINDSERRVTAEGLTNGTRLVPEGSLLFVVRGMSLKSEFRVGIAKRELAFGQDCKAVVPRTGVIPNFLANAVRAQSSKILDIVDDSGHGTGRLPTDLIEELEVGIPRLSEQLAISEVVSSLDEAVDQNLAFAESVERSLSLLLRPHAGAESDHASVSVSSLGRFVNGGAYTKHADGSGRLVIRIAELNGGVGPSSKFSTIETPAEKTAFPGDILFSWSGTLDVFRWTDDEAIINQHIFKVMPSEGVPAWVVYAKLREAMPEFQRIAADRATTMGHIKRGHLDTVTVTGWNLASDSMVAAGDALWAAHLEAHREAASLAKTRDALLPELLSGRLRVDHPERLLEGVA